MKKKLNKIRELKDKITRLADDNGTLDRRNDELRKRVRKFEEDERMMNTRIGAIRDEQASEISRLQEIIRWLIKPETANDPYGNSAREKAGIDKRYKF